MYIYIFICIYVYIYICMYVNIYSYIYVYIESGFTPACLFAQIPVYIFIYICIFIYIYVCIYVFIYLWLIEHIYICVYIYICVHIYLYMFRPTLTRTWSDTSSRAHARAEVSDTPTYDIITTHDHYVEIKLPHTAIPCNTLQGSTSLSSARARTHAHGKNTLKTYCNSLKRTATYCNALQHISKHTAKECIALWCAHTCTCSTAHAHAHVHTLQYMVTERIALRRTRMHTRARSKHTATHYNILQHKGAHRHFKCCRSSREPCPAHCNALHHTIHHTHQHAPYYP